MTRFTAALRESAAGYFLCFGVAGALLWFFSSIVPCLAFLIRWGP